MIFIYYIYFIFIQIFEINIFICDRGNLVVVVSDPICVKVSVKALIWIMEANSQS